MSISKKLKNYFREIEITKKGKTISGIKPIDKVKTYESFEIDLATLTESTQYNHKVILNDFIKFHKIQEESFKELQKNISNLKKKVLTCNCNPNCTKKCKKARPYSDKDFINYLIIDYSDQTDLKIKNWKTIQGLKVSELFIKNFRSLMSFRMAYSFKVIKELRKIVSDENPPNLTTKSKKREKETIWFKVGVDFATGEIQKKIKENNWSYHDAARNYDNKYHKNYRPYISDTANENKKSKNIFASPKKIKIIFDYCKENNLQMTEKFLKIAEQGE